MQEQVAPKELSIPEFLERFSAAPDKYPDASFRYQNGIINWKGGQSVVLLKGSGEVTVKNLRGSNETSFDGKLSADETKQVLQELVAHRFFDLQSKREKGKPDESRVVLELSAPSEKIQLRRELWDGERWQNPDLRAVVERFQKILSQVSKGQIRY